MYVLKIILQIGENGWSNFLLRPARKRKFEGRTVGQIMEENKDYKEENDRLANTISNMKLDIEDYDRLKVEYKEQNKKLAELFDNGIIDASGI